MIVSPLEDIVMPSTLPPLMNLTKDTIPHVDMVPIQDLEECTDQGFTPVIAAIVRGEMHVLEFLLSLGASTRNNTPLAWAACRDIDCVRLLLQHGADIQEPFQGDLTPLMFAAVSGQTETIKLLLDEGACADTTSLDGTTALMMAIIQTFNERTGPFINTYRVYTVPISFATHDMAGIDKLVQATKFLDGFNEFGRSALTLATQAANLPVIELLLEHGAAVNAPPGKAGALYVAVGIHHLELVQLFIDHGADVMAQTSKGVTALHLAACKASVPMAHLLLSSAPDAHALVHQTDMNGSTYLHRAAFSTLKPSSLPLHSHFISAMISPLQMDSDGQVTHSENGTLQPNQVNAFADLSILMAKDGNGHTILDILNMFSDLRLEKLKREVFNTVQRQARWKKRSPLIIMRDLRR